jgi:hypothetical protein
VEALEERIACATDPTTTVLSSCPASPLVAGPANLPLTATVTPDWYSGDHPLRGPVTFKYHRQGDPSDVSLGVDHLSTSSPPTASITQELTVAGSYCVWAEFSNAYNPLDPDSGDGYYYDSNSDRVCLDVVAGPTSGLGNIAPDSAQQGESFDMTVYAHDAYGNLVTDYSGTITFTSSDPNAQLPSDYMFTPADQGQHTFSVTLQTLGPQTVTATDTADPSLTTTANVLVRGPAAAFTVSGFPAQTQAGVPHNFTVQAIDAFGSTATDYTGTVHFTSSDPQANLPADYTFTPADGGVHVFGANLKTAGVQSISATDHADPTITGTQSNIVVTPGPFDHFRFSDFPAVVNSGTPFNFRVKATDSYDNTVPNYRDRVHFGSSDSRASLPADYTWSSTDQGEHVFTATLRTLGRQLISVTDMVTSRTDSQEFQVIAGTGPGSGSSPPGSPGGHRQTPAPLPAEETPPPWFHGREDAFLVALFGRKRQGWAPWWLQVED